MDRREFWATKATVPVWHAVVFSHPALATPFRLVANQFEPVTLSGQVHTPVPMSVQPPESSSSSPPRLTVSFPRQVVGREFKRQIALIAASGSRDAIEVTLAIYYGSTSAPEATWNLYVADQSGITFGRDTVQVIASDDNPMRRSVALIYQPEVFTGLVQL
ncbi:hypothetical protein [Aquabacterium sp. OR-4]|uniref:hypothetical protein n=1 Tax=Aquabacterium sp. OR-4 TaxID=2978127 RepID=UPI0021B3A772|nr:hypothetical protein [Aquabacterium sp. OR-4]MDT7834953.1 hypothetical protein [Aquabacterium sp. OR-4]